MKRVALVLSSGGARGFAHIGAIEELQERGYEIASVAGTSMGALIGGMFAAGKLEQVKERAFALDRKRMLALADMASYRLPESYTTSLLSARSVATAQNGTGSVSMGISGMISLKIPISRKGTERCSLSTAAFSIRCR